MNQAIGQLFIWDVQLLHAAEVEHSRYLPELTGATNDPEVRDLLTHHLQETNQQAQRLETILRQLGGQPEGNPPAAVTGLIADAQELLSAGFEGDAREIAIVNSARKMEHFEIACYGMLAATAQQAGEKDTAAILHESFSEEQRAEERLSALGIALAKRSAASEPQPA